MAFLWNTNFNNDTSSFQFTLFKLKVELNLALQRVVYSIGKHGSAIQNKTMAKAASAVPTVYWL